jgi:small conductance mechanosensitive channel
MFEKMEKIGSLIDTNSLSVVAVLARQMVSFNDFVNLYLGLPIWGQRASHVIVVLLATWLIKWVVDRYVRKLLHANRHVDDTTAGFVMRIMDLGIWALALVVALGAAGVDTAALAGGLAVGGFIVGFALKDTLGNLAAGFMLLLYRPFNVGDTVTIDGQSGDVVLLGMALTTMKAADGRIITLPNGKVLGNTILNHTREPTRRADVLVGIGYNDDIDGAVRAILEAVKQDPRVLAEPEPSVRITSLGDNAVGLQVRPWVQTADYWKAQADLHATVKQAIESSGGSIPFPQRDVHIHQASTTA